MRAEYLCKSCEYRWTGTVGPNECPRCSHVYVEWLNWEPIVEAAHADYKTEREHIIVGTGTGVETVEVWLCSIPLKYLEPGLVIRNEGVAGCLICKVTYEAFQRGLI